VVVNHGIEADSPIAGSCSRSSLLRKQVHPALAEAAVGAPNVVDAPNAADVLAGLVKCGFVVLEAMAAIGFVPALV